MISIIICSANERYLRDLRINLSETVGCTYEVLAYPNSDGKKGICEVYNQGAKEANFDLLCFVHEDVKILTQNWGNIVSGIFSENPALGLLGIAGGDYKSLAPSSWFNFEAPPEFPGKKYINLIQGYKFEDLGPQHDYSNPKNEELSRVACIDGVWMCTRKSIAKEFKFDEQMLKSFHGYDIDFSLAVAQKHAIAVTFEVLLHHYSEGGSTRGWVEDLAKVHKKWSRVLPINLTGEPNKACLHYEKYFFRNFLKYAKSLGVSYDSLTNMIQSAKASSEMGWVLYVKLRWFLYKRNYKA